MTWNRNDLTCSSLLPRVNEQRAEYSGPLSKRRGVYKRKADPGIERRAGRDEE